MKIGEVLQRLEPSEARTMNTLHEQQQEIIRLTALLIENGKEPLSCVRCRQSLSRVSDLEKHQRSAPCIDQYDFKALYAFFVLRYTSEEVPWVLETFKEYLNTPLSYHMREDDEDGIVQRMASGRLREEWTSEWIDTMGRNEPRFFELYCELRRHFPEPEEGLVGCCLCPQRFRVQRNMSIHVKACHRDHMSWEYFSSLLN